MALWEFYSFKSWSPSQPLKTTGLVCGVLLYLSVVIILFKPEWGIFSLISNVILFSSIFIVELFRLKDNPFQRISLTILGLLYIALPLALLNGLFFINFDPEPRTSMLFYFFILIWVNDTMAYICGVLTGKHPLYKSVSPKKTIEGSIGGAFFTIFSAWIISRFNSDIGMISWLGFALIIVIFGTLGDLVESMMKRSLQIKDSGNIMPGHGGVLDRFDAVIFSAPAIFSYLYLHYLLHI